MKVALVHMRSAPTGGTERYLSQLAGFLVGRGHRVHVVCRSHRGAEVPGAAYIRLRRPAIGAAWRMAAFARSVQRHVERSDYDVVLGLGRTFSHDVVRLGGGCHATYLELAQRAQLDGRGVLGAGRLKDRVMLALEARGLAPGAYRYVMTNSKMVKRDVMARHGVPEEQIRVIYNGVDTERFHPKLRARQGASLRMELGIGRDDFVVLFLGTGYGRKGLGRVLDALPELRRAEPRTRLIVVGYDSDQGPYRKRAPAEAVRFVGGRLDTERFYAMSNVYVLPTLYDPFANTTLEALATGVPVVTTPMNGAAELIEDGVQGSILDLGVVSSLAGAVLHWHAAERREAAKVAARALAEKHSAERAAAESAALLEAVAAEGR